MKKTLFFIIVSIVAVVWSSRTFSQELVVFIDDTAMSVKSHAEKGGYIYLTLQEGQIAVPKDRIKEIKKSKPSKNDISSPQSVPPAPQQNPQQGETKSRVLDSAKEGFRKPMGRPPGIRKQPSGEDEEEGDDEDDESGYASGADEDDDGEVKELSPASQDPSQPRPGRPMSPERLVRPIANSPIERKR